jgi:hypothetical protein
MQMVMIDIFIVATNHFAIFGKKIIINSRKFAKILEK